MWHCVLCILCVQSSSFPMRVAPTGAPPSPSLWLIMLRVYRDRETDRNIPFSVLLMDRDMRQNMSTRNMPLIQQRLSPEYVDGRGKSWINPSKAQLKDLEMVRMRYGHEDCHIIVPSFTMETGGKVPKRVCEHVDKYLRKRIRQGHSECLQCLNFPTPAELTKIG